MRRRALLASAGFALTTLNSGCLGSIQDTLDSSIQLGTVSLSNYDSAPHQFHVQIRRDGELIHEATHDLEAASESIIGSIRIEQTWGETAGSYVLRGKVDDNPWVEQSVDDALTGAPQCASARGVYDDLDSGEFEWYVRPICEW